MAAQRPADRLRFSGAAPYHPAVDDWFAERSDALAKMAHAWFERMRSCGEDVTELVHDGCPVACIGDVPFAYVNAFARHVNVGFFNGAALGDPAALLEGTGKRMRHVKLRPAAPIDARALERLITAAYEDARTFVDANHGGKGDRSDGETASRRIS